MNVLTLSYTTQALNNTNSISNKLNNNPPKIVYVQAKDGYTPVKGVDYFDGAKGLNAMSFNVTNTVVKEVPLIGEKGADGTNGRDGVDGRDAPYQEIRVNNQSKNIESKLTSDTFWRTLISCAEYRLECP